MRLSTWLYFYGCRRGSRAYFGMRFRLALPVLVSVSSEEVASFPRLDLNSSSSCRSASMLISHAPISCRIENVGFGCLTAVCIANFRRGMVREGCRSAGRCGRYRKPGDLLPALALSGDGKPGDATALGKEGGMSPVHPPSWLPHLLCTALGGFETRATWRSLSRDISTSDGCVLEVTQPFFGTKPFRAAIYSCTR